MYTHREKGAGTAGNLLIAATIAVPTAEDRNFFDNTADIFAVGIAEGIYNKAPNCRHVPQVPHPGVL